MLGGDLAVLQAPMFDGDAFDVGALVQGDDKTSHWNAGVVLSVAA